MSLDANFGLDVALGHKLDRIAGGLDRMNGETRRQREIERARLPFPSVMKASGVCPTPTASFALNFGGPDAGFYWVIRRIIAGGLTWTTSAAGTAEVYVHGFAGLTGVATSGPGSVASTRSLSDMADQSASLPNKAFYGSEELVVQANESISVVIVGGTAGQQYVANCGIQVVRLTTSLQAELEV